MSDDKIPYLTRALARRVLAAAREGDRRLERVAGEASAVGRLQSGYTMNRMREELQGILSREVSAMAREAFDAVGGGVEVADLVQSNARDLQTRLSNALAEFFRRISARHGDGLDRAAAATGNEFHAITDAMIEGLIDDFKHGMLEGRVMSKKDAIVNILTAVHSPGAIQQAGV